jgi:uncharacterized membrane protein (UPF0182 family)
VIPVDNNILYVEPVYLQAEDIEYPQLTRVVLVQQGEEPVMEPSLEESLNAILGEDRYLSPEKPVTNGERDPLNTIKIQIEQARSSLSALQKQFINLLDSLGEIADSGIMKSDNND